MCLEGDIPRTSRAGLVLSRCVYPNTLGLADDVVSQGVDDLALGRTLFVDGRLRQHLWMAGEVVVIHQVLGRVVADGAEDALIVVHFDDVVGPDADAGVVVVEGGGVAAALDRDLADSTPSGDNGLQR